jgi:hypothetical protein
MADLSVELRSLFLRKGWSGLFELFYFVAQRKIKSE